MRKDTIIAIDPNKMEDNLKRLLLLPVRKMGELFRVAVPLLRGNEFDFFAVEMEHERLISYQKGRGSLLKARLSDTLPETVDLPGLWPPDTD